MRPNLRTAGYWNTINDGATETSQRGGCTRATCRVSYGLSTQCKIISWYINENLGRRGCINSSSPPSFLYHRGGRGGGYVELLAFSQGMRGGYCHKFRIGVCSGRSQLLTLSNHLRIEKSKIDTLLKAQTRKMTPYSRGEGALCDVTSVAWRLVSQGERENERESEATAGGRRGALLARSFSRSPRLTRTPSYASYV